MNEQQKQLKAERDRRYRAKNAEKIAARRKKYREENKDKTKEQQRRHRENNPESVRERQKNWRKKLTPEQRKSKNQRDSLNYQKTPESWLKRKLNTLGRQRKDSTLTPQELIDLYYAQDGKCAITKIPMTTQPKDHKSISIDRIDSSLPYRLENVQLVCKAINLAKNVSSNESIIEFVKLLQEPGGR